MHPATDRSSLPTSFTIRNHRLFYGEDAMPFARSPHQSAGFAPRGIILHDTAGRLAKGNSVAWFLNPAARTSAHLTVERDGSVTQQVSFDRRAWHAGRSSYRGKSDVNGFAFGIEIVNPGKCSKLRSGLFQPWFKAQYREGQDGLHFSFASTREHGKGWWLDYSPQQIETVGALCQALIAKYDLDFIAGHWEIAPGRKIDPNPLFPLEAMRTKLFGEGEGAGEQPITRVDANLRRWPSYADNVIAVIDKGSPLAIIRSGTYSALGHPELWHLVDAGTQQGWMLASMIEGV